ncbi:hypothetical protein AB0B25_26880 [Nocardia sp. NPDC049190]|uniref:hypothetical protein n=1 Tax=Nocardia sp. NPDC049190 TaxID=3155650 RepID=UPI0033FE8C68
MEPPSVELTEYTPKDRAVLGLWWENDAIVSYVGNLADLLRDREVGDPTPGGRIARRTLRWMARDPRTGAPVGYVSVQITGQSGPSGRLSPVEPPYHGGVCTAVDPQ